MQDPLSGGPGYESLSIKDLLEARDLFHATLMRKPNVIGTAIGLHLHRATDEDGTECRFDNARVRDDSEPCILVLVTAWIEPHDFGPGRGRTPLDGHVPSHLDMPDGRRVPLCVVKVTPGEASDTPAVQQNWPGGIAGGGFPLTVEVQGRERSASIGCLVTDGHATYALTNRHVAGNPGEPVYSNLRGKHERIGEASQRQLTRLPFTDVYPDYAGARSYAALDVGLVRLDDVTGWTSQVWGIGEPGELADLSDHSFTLRLIGAGVSAHGAASGPLAGTIVALFYRYKSVGGFDWLADFLIAPEAPGGPQTRPGDSGTVWFLPPAPGQKLPRPLAVEWGGQTFLEEGRRKGGNFALATALSTVCNLLDVDVVGGHNDGLALYWGSEGHYTIAAKAVDYLPDGALKTFMQQHASLIAFDVVNKQPDEIASSLKQAADDAFIPLADVPDIVWKQSPHKVPGGRDTQSTGSRATGPEHPTHYADADQAGPDGVTLRARSLADPAQNLTVDAWRAFYDSVGSTTMSSRGLLPFRCWQFFDEMKRAVADENASLADKAASFLCAAGILSHYVGDACQPLHGSIYSDGDPNQQQTHTVHHRDGSTEDVSNPLGAGVHSAYEESMIDRHAKDLLDGFAEPGNDPPAQPPAAAATGAGTALAIVQLMDRTAGYIDPKTLVDAYVATGGGKSAQVLDSLWDQFGGATITCMKDGARVLAMLWQNGWGDGVADPPEVSSDQLKALYQSADFVPSLDLDHIGPALQGA
jgi:hypothetical protein